MSVKTAKLADMPMVMPKDLALPPLDEARTIGSNGQIQGAKIVTSPEMKAKRSSRIMNAL